MTLSFRLFSFYVVFVGGAVTAVTMWLLVWSCLGQSVWIPGLIQCSIEPRGIACHMDIRRSGRNNMPHQDDARGGRDG